MIQQQQQKIENNGIFPQQNNVLFSTISAHFACTCHISDNIFTKQKTTFFEIFSAHSARTKKKTKIMLHLLKFSSRSARSCHLIKKIK